MASATTDDIAVAGRDAEGPKKNKTSISVSLLVASPVQSNQTEV